MSIVHGSKGDKNFIAHYTPTNYSIAYLNTESATFAKTNPTTYTIETADFTLSNPQKDNYNFDGWVVNGGKPIETVTITKGTHENRTYTAKFSPKCYSINYNLDGGQTTSDNPTNYTVETETFSLNNPTKDGYTFKGWSGTNLNGDRNTNVTINLGSTGEKTYTANFTPISFVITYDLVSGSLGKSVTNPATYDISSSTITINNPIRKNYVFLGWTGTGIEENTASKTVKIFQGSTGERNYVASWTLKNVLTFELPNSVTLEMRCCPAGKFNMGSNNGFYDEEPIHEVIISKDFYMGTFEVTQQQYQAVTGNNQSSNEATRKPMVSVTWEEANSFCKTLNTILANELPDGYHFDLPTEAQWEYACRAGKETDYNNGKNMLETNRQDVNLNSICWYWQNWGINEMKSHTTGCLASNSFGLYDMHGNIWEWCRDWYFDAYYQQCYDCPNEVGLGIDPFCLQGLCTDRIVRGGSWFNYPDYCRSALRLDLHPSYCDDFIGFRLALVSD